MIQENQQRLTSVSWAPWPGCALAVGFGRPFLFTSPSIRRVQVSPPPSELPLVWRSEDVTCFELPLPTGRAENGTTQEVILSLYATDGREYCERLTLGGGIPRSRARPSEDDEILSDQQLQDNREAVTQTSESLISHHVESVNELLFPRNYADVPREKAQGITVVPWNSFDEAFWGRDDLEGPMRLIVRIALECSSVLEGVCQRPRRVLRRERLKERLDRVQQMDDTCIRWFVRQPGQTILEKAGPRQRVMSVVRLESADTPENRVVRDLLERCLLECRRYLRDNASIAQAARVQLVRRFRNRVRRWLRFSDISFVPIPVGVPQANYVLQFDDRYRRLWYWYARLRRQQTYEDDLWRWQHRTWAEHATLAVLHAFSSLQEDYLGYRASISLRTDQRCGCFIDERSSASAWSLASNGPVLVETITQSQFASAAGMHPMLGPLSRLGPDLVAIVKRPFSDVSDKGQVLAMWSLLASPGNDKQKELEARLAALIRQADGSVLWDIVTPVFIIPQLGTRSQALAEPVRFTASARGVYGVGWLLPVPVHRHLLWLGTQIRDWAVEGVL